MTTPHISAEPGDTSTPQRAILGFEHAYFVDRSAVKARTFVTGDAQVGNEAAPAIGIAGLPGVEEHRREMFQQQPNRPLARPGASPDGRYRA